MTPLQELQQRLAVVRDRVRGVARGHYPGFYLFGPAGTGKTYTVRMTLDELNIPYQYHLGHLTPMGLFDLLAQYHDRIIVLDDVAEILANRIALQILLAALGNQPDATGVRLVKYRRQGRDETVRFTGGIIIISNLELHSAPLLEALKSRVHYLRHDPSDEQIAALMREIASKGRAKPKLSPEECREVAEFVIAESRRVGCRLDIRLLVDKSLPDYAQYRNHNTETHWKDLILATLEQQVMALKYTRGPAATRTAVKADEHQIVRDIVATCSTTHERLAAWREQTQKSERAFYRRLKEIGSDTLTLSESVSMSDTAEANGDRVRLGT
jgi:hypothetical protein